VAGIDGRKLKDIAKESPVRFRILGVNHDVRTVDQT
jgi:hypothetical protein